MSDVLRPSPSSAPTNRRLQQLKRHLDNPSLQPSQHSNMSKQAPHALTMIPGPIEFDDAVLDAMSTPSIAHTHPDFVNVFSKALKMTRTLFLSTDPDAQPLVLSGSGTLGWDIVGANFVEAGDNVLVVNTGFFSDRFVEALTTYRAEVDQVTAPVGDVPSLDDIEKALRSKSYKAITITHVDTSTGVLVDIKKVAELVHKVSPATLIIVDGVCSVGVEEIRFDEWKLDYVLTASQKAIGAPAGLSVSFASKRAVDSIAKRKQPVASYFASLNKWIPIMQAYEGQKGAYFATPAVQNIYSYYTSLSQFATSPESMENRFKVHAQVSDKIKDAIKGLGLKIVANDRSWAAHGLTAIYTPEGVAPTQILPLVGKQGITLAGGIHPKIASKYIRFGHMGVSVTKPELGHIDKVLNALSSALKEL